MSDFNVQNELETLQKQTQIIRKRRFSKSRLDKFKGELLLLKDSGASTAELQRFLRTKKIKVAWSTVYRWLEKNG